MAVELKRQAYSVKRIEKRHSLMSRLFAIRYSPNARSRGFSIIELMTVVGIITIVTSVVLANNSKYGGSVLLQNLAYDIALSIRQAQVYGISVRGFGVNNSTFTVGYGMHFAVNDPTHYELFADLAGTGIYDADFDPSENIPPSPYVIGRGYYIAKLCAPAGTDAVSCTSVASPQRLDIVFKRPEPDASIRASGNPSLKDSGRIVVASPRGDILSIVVDVTGQISVQ